MSGASICCVSLSVAWAAWTISETAEIHLWRDPTERWILVLVLFAYVLAWLPVALLPYDIANNITGNCTNDPTIRGRWWTLLYLANLFTGYVANDYARSYIYSGAFTIQRKMAEGWRILWTWYAYAGLATLPLLLLIAWNNQFSLSAWQVTYESIYAMANLYGILMFILLLAHALVELPKRLYHLSSIKVRSKLYYHELGAAASELEREHQEWEVECESIQRAERETGWREQWPGQSAQVLAERLKTDQKVMQLEADSLSAIASLGRSSSSKPPSTPPRGRHAAAAAAASASTAAPAVVQIGFVSRGAIYAPRHGRPRRSSAGLGDDLLAPSVRRSVLGPDAPPPYADQDHADAPPDAPPGAVAGAVAGATAPATGTSPPAKEEEAASADGAPGGAPAAGRTSLKLASDVREHLREHLAAKVIRCASTRPCPLPPYSVTSYPYPLPLYAPTPLPPDPPTLGDEPGRAREAQPDDTHGGLPLAARQHPLPQGMCIYTAPATGQCTLGAPRTEDSLSAPRGKQCTVSRVRASVPTAYQHPTLPQLTAGPVLPPGARQGPAPAAADCDLDRLRPRGQSRCLGDPARL